MNANRFVSEDVCLKWTEEAPRARLRSHLLVQNGYHFSSTLSIHRSVHSVYLHHLTWDPCLERPPPPSLSFFVRCAWSTLITTLPYKCAPADGLRRMLLNLRQTEWA